MKEFKDGGAYHKAYGKAYKFHKEHSNIETYEQLCEMINEIQKQFTTPFEQLLAVAITKQISSEYEKQKGKSK